jgi:hypothetical protein
LAAIRHLFDWLVTGQILRINPAASVRGPRHVVKDGKTPVLSPDENSRLLDSINVSMSVGLRDRRLCETGLVEPALAKLWLLRDQNLAEVRKKFNNRAVRESIEKDDAALADIYQKLYELSIDFGAHPNEKGVLGSVEPGSLATGNMQVMMLAGDSLQLQHGLKNCGRIGICSLKIFNLVVRLSLPPRDPSESLASVASVSRSSLCHRHLHHSYSR